jgi:hypothetical protein
MGASQVKCIDLRFVSSSNARVNRTLVTFTILCRLMGMFHPVPGNTKGGSITVPLTSCLIGLESAV